MSKHNLRLSIQEFEYLGRTATGSGQCRVSGDEHRKILNYRAGVINKTETKTETNQYANDKDEPFKLTAWDNAGFMMDIDTYCKVYGLPRGDIRSYKLVSHTGTPYYNIAFHEKTEEIERIFDPEFLAEIVNKHIEPVYLEIPPIPEECDSFDRLVYTDCHIGMETNKNGHALYPTKYDKEEIKRRIHAMAIKTILEKKSQLLFVDDLGDYLDGWNGETVRKGHDLPQNMDNETQFDFGLEMKMYLADLLAPHFSEIHFHAVTNDNHAGSFGYVLNSAFKQILTAKYGHIEVTLLRRFIDHYFIGEHCFVLTHGKDSKALKFGFKVHQEPKQTEKITQYLQVNQINPASFKAIHFCKGDSHQALFDQCGSDDFDYNNYPAFAPSSEWIQTNFKKNRSGFTLENHRFHSNESSRKLIWF